MAVIALSNGGIALVDDDDAEMVRAHRWRRWVMNKGASYVVCRKRGQPLLLLHRLLMNPGDGMVVDHINGDGLDNRRANLRVCSHRDNVRNRRKSSRGAFKGVTRTRGGWVARLFADGKRVHIGTFASAEEAAAAHDIVAVLRFGEFACLNFPHVFPEFPFRKA